MRFVRESRGVKRGLTTSESSEVDVNKDLSATGPEDVLWTQLWDTNVHLLNRAKVHGQIDRAKKEKRGDDVACFV